MRNFEFSPQTCWRTNYYVSHKSTAEILRQGVSNKALQARASFDEDLSQSMQTAWSRSLRPQSSCRCISCINQLPGILSRRTTTTGIARKRLTAGDAFTLLLTPVFGGALIVDTKAKGKRRKEWDEKIAAAKAEIEQIRGSGFKTYNIRSRNLRRLPALSRNYSTAVVARLVSADEDNEDPIEAVEWPSAPEPYHHDQASARTPPVSIHDSRPTDEIAESQRESTLNRTALETCKRVQRLVAIKLAIKMILHVHIGKSPRYINNSSDYVFDHDQSRLPHNANELICHLKQICNTLRILSSEELRLSWAAYQSLTRGESCNLDKDMCEIARRFRQGELNVAQLVERFAESLLSSPDSPTVHGYIPLLKVLSRARFEELSSMVDGTMIEARLPYDQHAVFTLLWQYGKNKEARYFDRLIKKLTTDGANARFGEQWLWRNIDGTLVPMPPSQDPQILQILIYAALKCNQPHRAEAWSKLLSWTRNGHLWRSHVMRNFLKYYSAHRNWHKGKVWLKSALLQAEMLAGQGIRHLQRVTFSMLDFCVAYGERALYRDIMKAAGECRLGVYSADPDLTLTQRAADILREWTLCHGRVCNSGIDALSPVEKARLFSHKLRHIHEGECEGKAKTSYLKSRVASKEQPPTRSSSQNYVGGLPDLERIANVDLGKHSEPVTVSRENAEALKWKELCRRQQMQLDSLKCQLQYFNSLKIPKSASSEGEPDNVPADAVEKVSERTEDRKVHEAGLTIKVEQEEGFEQIASKRETLGHRRSSDATINSIAVSNQQSLNPSLALALSQAITPSDMEQFKEPEAAPFMEETIGPLRQVTSTPRSVTKSSPPFFRPLLDSSPQNMDQCALSASLPHQPTSNLNNPKSLQTIIKDKNFLPSPATLPASPFRRIPTISKLEDALTFCTYILNSLSAHIKTNRPLRPLYMLVSTLPRDLLVTIIIDGTFTHFVRQMLTKWEQDVFWPKLTLEIRERQEGGLLAAVAEETKEKREKKAEEEAEDQTEAEAEAEAETKNTLPITRDIQLPKQVIRHIGSGRGLPLSKTPYRSLRLQFDINHTSGTPSDAEAATSSKTEKSGVDGGQGEEKLKEEAAAPPRPITRGTFPPPTTKPASQEFSRPMELEESRPPAFKAPYRSLRLDFQVEEETGGAVC